MSNGLFISFEGTDGVGKTTQIDRLYHYLKEHGLDVVTTHEPGGTSIGTTIRHMLLSTDNSEKISSRTEALLYAADRAQHVHSVIEPALEKGSIVITDRYIDSTVAYQCGGRQLDNAEIENLNMWASGDLVPQRTYLLDMDPEIAHTRIKGHFDRLESEPKAFQSRTRQAFLSIARDNPARVRVIDAEDSQDGIWEQIRSDIDAVLLAHNQQPSSIAQVSRIKSDNGQNFSYGSHTSQSQIIEEISTDIGDNE